MLSIGVSFFDGDEDQRELDVASSLDLIKSGATIVEGTAGNTGIGLAHLCNALGFKCVIFMPNNQSQVCIQSCFFGCLLSLSSEQEKIDILRVLGAQVTTVPVVPITDPNNYNHHVTMCSSNEARLRQPARRSTRHGATLKNTKIQYGPINSIIKRIATGTMPRLDRRFGIRPVLSCRPL